MNIAVEGIPSEEDGMVVDFKKLKNLVNSTIVDKLDHQNLNEVMPAEFSVKGNTTCEVMIVAFWWALDHEISEKFPGVKLVEIKLWETENSYSVLTREMVYNAN
jgi:6-pyruvoyltetrahydropterin/6-carboxytetrahydropterin synthase